MPPVPPAPYGYAIFCDDIRAEEGGKSSLMGIYRGVMFVYGALPIQLPRFCIMATYCEPREITVRRTGDLELKVFLPETGLENAALSLKIPAAQAIEAARSQIIEREDDPDVEHLLRLDVPIILQPFIIAKLGIIKVRAYFEDDIIKVGALRIENQPTPPPKT